MISALLAVDAAAQDGNQLYTLYCSACHGADGRGAPEGAGPPLAGSPWVHGEPDRSIEVVLRGLHGPVEVAGRVYDLEMPPQGAVLSDDQIAAILTYIRGAWGNQGSEVAPAKVAEVRSAGAGRMAPWTAPELLARHPLPLEKSALSGLISRSYEGAWNQLPDFPALIPSNVEEEHDGLLDVADAPFEDEFAILWEGSFAAPADGEYEFFLDADDAATVWIDGEEIASVRGRGAMDGTRSTTGEVTLAKGSHPVRVGYLEMAGEQSIALGWKPAGESSYRWLSARRSAPGRRIEPIPVMPENGRPVIYRNFIDGTTPRAIGVGFPGGMNLAWSADHLAPELLWTGDFIDGAPKWIDRGTRPSPPAGESVTRLSSSRFLPPDARFRGYKLDAAGNPTFAVDLGGQTLLDAWCTGTATDGTPCLVRSLTLVGGRNPRSVPLGAFEKLESSVPTPPRDGIPTVLLKPGMETTHRYLLPR